MSGRPFTVPLTLNDDIPAVIKDNLDDVDLEGRNFHTFARDVFRTGLSYGIGYILVDFPTTTGARS
jgi:hypothetical protein